MFVIDRGQWARFQQGAQAQFEQTLAAHVRSQYRDCVVQLDDRALVVVIRAGCRAARRLGFATEIALRRYTELAVMLGSGFSTDPQLEWAQEVLSDPMLSDPRARLDALCERADDYRERVLAPGEVFPGRALRAALAHPLSSRGRGRVPSPDAVPVMLRGVWPEKAHYLGDESLGRMATAVSTGEATIDVITLGFLFGHRFAVDPLYPWLATEPLATRSGRGGLIQTFAEAMGRSVR